MKRRAGAALILTLGLAGCHQAETDKTPREAPHNPLAPTSSNAPVEFIPVTHSRITPEQVPLLEQINRENIKVVSSALPSVVRVSATRAVDPRVQSFGRNFFQFPFGRGPQMQPRDTSYGTGVIISKDGYIVTNSHVVADSRELQVQTLDKRIFSARLVAADDAIDVAVLKVDATDLVPLPWGDSDKVEVGEQVFAIGNPFDFDNSVSKGMVSAKGRSIETSNSYRDYNTYQDYIQTDAAINPGNSGGALVNIRGELIGLSAAIASSSGYNMGVGFAIPSKLVRFAVQGMLKEGRLVRGYLGVMLPETVDEGVTAQLGIKSGQGALLAGVLADSPAQKAGLQAGDFITAVDGHKVASIAELRLVVAQVPIGKVIEVTFVRSGKPQAKKVAIVESPQAAAATINNNQDNSDDSSPPITPDRPDLLVNVLGGLQVVDLNDKNRQKYNIDGIITTGVIVSGIQDGSVADAKGIMRGDVIESVTVNRGASQVLNSAKDFSDLSAQMKADQSAVLLLHHGKKSSFAFLSPPK